ncbi:uncharacterized protein MONOS_9328 [Monocercomonoides exilis]|uniref:uncharacterized protein n=1 Tax=Monocercomonoides exilis TaxID=2049356 RepID=UPI00355A18C0|nr:hypothetical protein MONOS_9328 [Monocercomonoides exilis]|eukprot:MONOS_9328.1-p1 / transcript=MONOS_9328.1 / gene=MONOS_9328 / organism=Monocercomonoides_exilis_PA203 / gene_product=unspecified product / transcript_product=unspecified product / location=Mono_scaffold00381:19000-20076(+) / protein_length=359 / sequence_SO=supercontig / SO=protein_coding / is_pseudo=false
MKQEEKEKGFEEEDNADDDLGCEIEGSITHNAHSKDSSMLLIVNSFSLGNCLCCAEEETAAEDKGKSSPPSSSLCHAIYSWNCTTPFSYHSSIPKQFATSTSFLLSYSPTNSTSSRTIQNSARRLLSSPPPTIQPPHAASALHLPTLPIAPARSRTAPASAAPSAGSQSSQLLNSQTLSEAPAGRTNRIPSAAAGIARRCCWAVTPPAQTQTMTDSCLTACTHPGRSAATATLEYANNTHRSDSSSPNTIPLKTASDGKNEEVHAFPEHLTSHSTFISSFSFAASARQLFGRNLRNTDASASPFSDFILSNSQKNILIFFSEALSNNVLEHFWYIWNDSIRKFSLSSVSCCNRTHFKQ